MGIFDWLFGNKKKSPEEKLTEHLKKEREKSIPKHRGNKPVRLQPRVVGTKKETASVTKKTVVKEENKKNIFSTDSLKVAVKEWLNDNSNAKKKYGHISEWNVSQVTNMEDLFCDAESFNEDIGKWDVSKVSDMNNIFYSAKAFNQDIGNWNVSNVKDMWNAFSFAESFNQDIGKWDVSNVENMNAMFSVAKNFNKDISNWNVSNVSNMSAMFLDTDKFNQDIGNWDVSHVEDMSSMFCRANAFNQDISKWDVSKVSDMSNIFGDSEVFRQDLSAWNLKGMDSHIEAIVEYLNKFSSKKIIITKQTKERLKERGKKTIEIKINDVKISTTIDKFENEISQDYAVEDYDDDYNVYLTSSHDEVCNLLNDITDQAIVVSAEHYADDAELGEIGIEEVSYLNCECPDKLKKYYNGELFISHLGKLLEIESDDYKKIDFDEIWETSEITNSGVVCSKFSDYIKHV